MADYKDIAGRIRTTAADGIVVESQEIIDLQNNKTQQEINSDVQTELGDRYTKEETYSKEQLDNLITTPDVNYVSVVATNATAAVTDILPATGEANTIYRVGNWNGTQYDTTMYALFAWNGTTYVCLAVRSFVGEVYDVSVNHPDGQGDPTPYADLTEALGTDGANIPADIRRGGMSIKFIQGTVQNSDNKYVQYRYMGTSTTGNPNPFLDEKNWLNEDINDRLIATFSHGNLNFFSQEKKITWDSAISFYYNNTRYVISANTVGITFGNARIIFVVWDKENNTLTTKDVNTCKGDFIIAIITYTASDYLFERVGFSLLPYTVDGKPYGKNPVQEEATNVDDMFSHLFVSDYNLQLYPSEFGWIYSSSGNIQKNEGSLHKAIPVTEGMVLAITAGEHNSYIVFTDSINYGEWVGLGNRTDIAAGSTVIVTVPATAKYLIVGDRNNGNVSAGYYLPTSIKSLNNFLKLNQRVENSTDLDDYDKVGWYQLDSNISYTNSPITKQPSMIVNYDYVGLYRVQMLYAFNDKYIWYRRRTGGGTWNDWEKMEGSFACNPNLDSTNLNDYDKTGWYQLNSTIDYTNSPITKQPSILINYGYISNSAYRVQMLYALHDKNIWLRQRTGGGTWGDWKIYAGERDNISYSYTSTSIASQGENKGHHLKVMSYNIAMYNNDTSIYVSDEKLLNLRKMLNDLNPDIIGIQEDRQCIDASNTKDSLSYLFSPVYPLQYSTPMTGDTAALGNYIRSRIQANTHGGLFFSNYATRPKIEYATYTFGNKTLLFISTHAVANAGDSPDSQASIAMRVSNYAELFGWIAGTVDLKGINNNDVHVPTHEWCVIVGDMNTITDTDKINLTTAANSAGYILGNGGYLGWLKTALKYTGSMASLDNIIVSSNVVINSYKSNTSWYDQLYSDHTPQIAEVTLLDT